RQRRRNMHPRSPTMLSQQRQTGVLETIEPPSWIAPRIAFGPRSQGRIAGYPIGEDQSAGLKAILQPAD
ncbi:MAG: hypothetical protein ACLPKT_23295, partial [Methylocella sp.]